MKSYLISPLVVIILVVVLPPAVYGNFLHEALSLNVIEIKALAGDEGIQLKLKNTSNISQKVVISPGTIFSTGNDDLQDVMAVQMAETTLLPGETKEMTVKGMCINAEKGSYYSQDLLYQRQAEEKLQLVARYIAEKELWNSTGQNMVWCISDGHDIAGVYSDDGQQMKEARQFLAQLTGLPVPWYTKHYTSPDFEDTTANAVFSGEISRIEGEFDYTLRSNDLVSFGIYDEQGNLVQLFFEEKGAHRGYHQFSFSFEATGLKSGKYFARMWGAGSLIKQMEISI